jgi:hypothetical protein
MSKITYSDKDKDSGSTPTNQWTDSDANEVKTSVNVLYDGSDKAWINLFKTGTSTTQVIAQGTTYLPLANDMFGGEVRQIIPTSALTGLVSLPTKGNYLLHFDADIEANQIIELLAAVFYYGTVNGVPDQQITGVFPSSTFMDIEVTGVTRHLGMNCIFTIPADTPTILVTGIKVCVQHNYAGNVTLTFKKATKLTLLYLGI